MFGAILLNALDTVDVDVFLLRWLKRVGEEEEEEGRSTSAEAIVKGRCFPNSMWSRKVQLCWDSGTTNQPQIARATAHCLAKNNQERNLVFTNGPGKDDGES